VQRHGHVWVQNVGNGLLIVGEVDGDPPDFPRNKNLILERDHVEIWLADSKYPDLPPMGWGNGVEGETLPNGADSCADWAQKSISENKQAAEKKCRRWADMQSHYPPDLQTALPAPVPGHAGLCGRILRHARIR